WGRLQILSTVATTAMVVVVRKTTDQARTTYGDDSQLIFPMLANESWAIEGMILARNNSSQGGITFGFETTSGSFVAGYHSNQDNASGFIGGVLTTNNETASFDNNSANGYMIIFVKILVTNGA